MQMLSDSIGGTFGRSVTVSRRVGGTFSGSTGTETGYSTTSVTLTASRSKVSQLLSTGEGGAELIVEQVTYWIDASDFSATSLTAPRENDKIVSGGMSHYVVGFDRECEGKIYRITCRAEKTG